MAKSKPPVSSDTPNPDVVPTDLPLSPESVAQSSSTKPVVHNLSSSRYYFNRELSWLEFNRRVLEQALDDRTLLLERLKFLAIFSSNLDEFFMVRVAGLKQQVEAQVQSKSPDGRSPQEQLDSIRDCLLPMVQRQHQHFDEVLRPALRHEGIFLLDFHELSPKQKDYCREYFYSQLFAILTPLAVDPSHPFPFISNQSLNLGILLWDDHKNRELFARLRVDIASRFVELPKEPRSTYKNAAWVGITLEQIIAHNLEALFPGLAILECHPFRVTRNADLALEEEEADDLLLAIEQELRRKRKGGSVVRLEVSNTISPRMCDRLVQELELQDKDVYELTGMLSLQDLFALASLPVPHLKYESWKGLLPPELDLLPDIKETATDTWEVSKDILRAIRREEMLVHHPYHSFAFTVQQFITQAAHDPDVVAIKITLYRTSGDSPIINALIDAAENGKQVVALVELKARFDEENNINWARKLEQAGVHVVYGIVGLKTHTKTTLVVRREGQKIKLYVHIGTGNYNPKTAKLYTDLSLFSCNDVLGRDLIKLFNYLTGYAQEQSFEKLLVAPLNLRSCMIAMIQRERDLAQAGQPGRIIAKMNSLVDPEIIRNLYEASQTGVQIDLIVRGICALRPGISGLSETIRVVSVIGRFLEHSRVFYFGNGGEEEIYIGSADWMNRNLSRRIEAVVPIETPNLRNKLKRILDIFLDDNRKAWDLQSNGQYIQRRPKDGEPERDTHAILMAETLAAANSPTL